MSRAPSWLRPARCSTALKKGRPGYAAMDVYEQEPVTGGNHPFLKMDNVLCTPHLGWAEWDNFELYFRECFEQIVAFEKGSRCGSGNPTVKPRGRSRLVSRAQRSTSWWCAADPGPGCFL